MPQSSRTFRLFVSSTFSDLKEERSALQKYVFPRLRELALSHGCRFQAIDLRWGVSEEAALDQQTMKICQTEIERCQKVSPRPNFLILLGERFGWRPLPYSIPADEFERLLPHLTESEKSLACWQVQNGEPTGWYRRDENAIPPQYLLQPRQQGSRFEEYEVWESQVERPLVAALECAALAAGLSLAAMVKYSLSATGQEIELGAMQAADAPGHVLAFLRSFKNPHQVWSPEVFFESDPNLRQRQQALRESLKQRLGGNVYEVQAFWHEGKPGAGHIGTLPATLDACLALKEDPSAPPSICQAAWLRLSRMILEEAAKLQVENALQQEVNGHLAFAAEQRGFFIGREAVLEQLEHYLTEKYDKPMGLWGYPGVGKTALMAQMVARAAKAVPGALVVARFIGATPESTDLRGLLEGICRQVTRAYGGDETTLPTDLLELIAELPNRLALATPQRPLILLLDGLNQLTDEGYAFSLEWLPVHTPPSVRIICSSQWENSLQERFKFASKRLLQLQPLTPAECELMLESWLEQSHRKLNPVQFSTVLKKLCTKSEPLYMRLALEEVIPWKSYQAAPDLPLDLDDLIDRLFNRLAQPENHGETLVEYSVALLAAAKNGLSEDELLDILWQQDEVRYDFYARSPKSPKDVDSMPVVIWARLYADLEPYLAERASDGASLIGYRHHQMAYAASYSRKGENKVSRVYATRGEEIVPYHTILARYFATQPNYRDHEEHSPNLRKLAELLHQQKRARLVDDTLKTFYDFTYMQARLRGHGINALIDDYNLHWNELSGHQKDLRLLRGALLLTANTLVENPDQLAEQLFGRLIDSKSESILQLLQQARFSRKSQWLRPLNACLQPPGSALFFTLADDVGANQMQLSPDERLALTCNLDAVKLWDLTRRMCLVTITKEMLPLSSPAIAPVANSIYRAVLLPGLGQIAISGYDHTITLWDAITGSLVRVLEGHTSSVKALVASADGKRLVSGDLDGALRVWDAQKGTCLQAMKGSTDADAMILFDQGQKLLTTPVDYGSGFDKSLSVWNLQSGTLLHRLEGHDTAPTASAVSPDGRWAFSGDSNGTFKIWDLQKGTCQNTLQACRGAVETIAVLPDSRVVYTAGADSPAYRMVTGKPADYAIRAWEIATGKLWKNLVGHSGTINRLVMAEDGSMMVSVAADNMVKVWDLPNWRCRATLHGHANSVTGAGIRPHYQSIVTASKDGTLKVWDINASQDSDAPDQHLGEVRLVAITPDGQRAVSATMLDASFAAGDVPRVWDVPAGCTLHLLKGHTKDVFSLHLLPDGQHVLTDGVDRTSKVWNLATGACEKTLNTRCMGITADGRLIVTQSGGKKVLAWSIEENRAALEWQEPEKNMVIDCLALHPNGQTLLMANRREWNGTADPLVRMVELKSGKVVCEMNVGDPVSDILFAPDGRHAFLDSQLWDMQTGQRLYILKKELKPLAFTPDGGKVICVEEDLNQVGIDRAIRYQVVNASSGARLFDVDQKPTWPSLSGDYRPLVCILPLVNGVFWAVTAAPGNRLRLWSLDDGREICAYRGDAFFECFTASVDGLTLAAGSADGRVHLLRLENVEFTIPVVTAWQGDESGGGLLGMFRKPASAAVAFGCPQCRQWSQVNSELLGRKLACPKCNRTLMLAPTTISGDWRAVAQAWSKFSKS